MNNNINIADILRDCPKGTKLYSPVCGESKLKLINQSIEGVVIVVGSISNGKSYAFNEDGSFTSASDAECLLFPSKDMRDWSKFFKRGDVVYNEHIRAYAFFKEWVDDTYTRFRASYFYEDNDGGHYDTNCECDIRDYSKVIDGKVIDVLIKRLEEKFNGKYTPATLRVEPTKARHDFKPFDRVLAREDDHKIWYAEIFSHFSADTSEYVCIGGAYDQCIPYNDRTARLVGTKGMQDIPANNRHLQATCG